MSDSASADVMRLNLEQACLRRLAAGQDVWDEFARLFGPCMYFEFRKWGIINPDDVDDLQQEVAIKVFRNDYYFVRNHLEYYPEQSFKTVLRTVIRNIVVVEWRKRQAQPEIDAEDYADHIAGFIKDEAPDDNPAELHYRDALLLSVFTHVTHKARDDKALRMLYERFCLGLGVKDIAQRLGMQANAVTLRINRYVADIGKLYGGELRNLA